MLSMPSLVKYAEVRGACLMMDRQDAGVLLEKSQSCSEAIVTNIIIFIFLNYYHPSFRQNGNYDIYLKSFPFFTPARAISEPIPVKTKRTWTEKLHDNKDLPKTFEASDEAQAKKLGGRLGIIPAPLDVDAAMRKVPKGRLATVGEIRAYLASAYETEMACPLTTGIFAWIAANAAEEARAAGKKRITPYWRTLKTKGEINPKYPGGVEAVAALIRAEGHQVEQRGKRWFVKDYEKRLVKWSR